MHYALQFAPFFVQFLTHLFANVHVRVCVCVSRDVDLLHHLCEGHSSGHSGQ